MTVEGIRVREDGIVLSFSFDDMMDYHGPGFPGGVAHAYKVMERALPLLADDGVPERRKIVIETPFSGPGGRDAFELVTRAVTGQRFVVDAGMTRPELGSTRQSYIFRLRCGARSVTVTIREGHVRQEFLDLGRKPGRSAAEEEHLTGLKKEMADRLMALPATAIYDADQP